MNIENTNFLNNSTFFSPIPQKELKGNYQPQATYPTKRELFFTTPDRCTTIHQAQTELGPSKNLCNSFYSPNFLSPNKEVVSDRFIPIRSNNTTKNLFDLADQLMSPPEKSETFSEESRNQMKYNTLLENQLLDVKHSDFFSRFKKSDHKSPPIKPKRDVKEDHETHDTVNTQQGSSHPQSTGPKLLLFKTPLRETTKKDQLQISPFMDIEKEEEETVLETFKTYRQVSKTPYKVLDAPSLVGDFYLDLIHWSARNQLAVSLGTSIWLWSGETSTVSKFCSKKSAEAEYTAVQWDPKGNVLSVGDSNGGLELFDFESSKLIFRSKEHFDRIDCISWNGPNLFSTGSRDSSILTYDLRVSDKPIIKFAGHTDEVCGLKWSPEGHLLASGGNDNKVFLWNLSKKEPVAQINEHNSAVKAMAWSPHQQNLLLTGGGYTDKTIKIWNTLSMTKISEIVTDSQVCNLLFSKNSNEFLSTHGLTGNQVIVWKYPELAKISVIDGQYSHSDRVLYLSDSPDGESIVTGSSDETLKFWKVFPKKEVKRKSNLLFPSMNDLR